VKSGSLGQTEAVVATVFSCNRTDHTVR